MKEASASVAEEKKKKRSEDRDEFWMRDPKTGNWVPESRVGHYEADEVEQREKLLPKNNLA